VTWQFKNEDHEYDRWLDENHDEWMLMHPRNDNRIPREGFYAAHECGGARAQEAAAPVAPEAGNEAPGASLPRARPPGPITFGRSCVKDFFQVLVDEEISVSDLLAAFNNAGLHMHSDVDGRWVVERVHAIALVKKDESANDSTAPEGATNAE
jgi:hypothetical protein